MEKIKELEKQVYWATKRFEGIERTMQITSDYLLTIDSKIGRDSSCFDARNFVLFMEKTISEAQKEAEYGAYHLKHGE
ncbi:hypothetical protein ACFL00_02830 [Pseudomonadota bacterium]